jgi:hypothetical protein
MAKKAKKEAVKPEQSKERLAKAKYHAEKAAKRARAAAASTAAANGTSPAAAPPAVTPAPKKDKRPRYVREKKPEELPAPADSPAVTIPPRSTSFSAKLITKGLALPPKEEKGLGPIPGR